MKNRLMQLLGIKIPLILGPMRRITLGPMAAAVSENGGLGQIATSTLTVPELREEIQKAQNLTNQPLGINIPLHRPNALEFLETAIDRKIPVISTSGGSPDKIMDRAKGAGIIVLHKVSTTDMGIKAQEAGVDGVIAMGFEAGGHGGRSHLTTLCLVPQLCDVLDIPVVAAGGISDFRGFLAALALGAEGVEIGTRFLASKESPTPEYYKEALLRAPDTGTLMVGEERMSLRILDNPAARILMDQGKEKKEHIQVVDYSHGEAEGANTIMPAGQGVGLIHSIEEISRIITGFITQAAERSEALYGFFKTES
jgi:enoyl-[acyl-carrier protein] reductase II